MGLVIALDIGNYRRHLPAVVAACLAVTLSACGDDGSASTTTMTTDAPSTGATDPSTTASTSASESESTGDTTTASSTAASTDPSGTATTDATSDTATSDTATSDTATDATSTDATSTDATSTDATTTDATTGVEPPEGFADDFAGDGALLGYTTNNPNSLPDVARADGRYRANLVDNSDNITLHYHQDQGRLDAKVVEFPFDVVARNIGIGTQEDSQLAPPPAGNPFLFAGVQVHVTDLESRNSSHIVVGHRGNTPFTVEGKNTVDGSSSVNDAGADIVGDGRADIRVVGNVDRTLTIYWQVPNPDPGTLDDAWTLYNGTGTLPGEAPAYGPEVYVGLITYAFNQTGVPFVGTCDALEQL